MDGAEDPRRSAEARAAAVRAAAEARAATRAADAEARARTLAEARRRQLQMPDRPLPEADLGPGLARLEDIARAYLAEHLPETPPFREAVAIRAYYKAERRGFGAGGEGGDWAEAEQDVLALPPFGGGPAEGG